MLAEVIRKACALLYSSLNLPWSHIHIHKEIAIMSISYRTLLGALACIAASHAAPVVDLFAPLVERQASQVPDYVSAYGTLKDMVKFCVFH